jgi:hypothetical protein
MEPSLSEKPLVAQLFENFPTLYGFAGPLPCSQETTTGLQPD